MSDPRTLSEIPLLIPEKKQRTINDILGPPQQERTIDDILGPKELYDAADYGGEYMDALFAKQRVGKILDMFGQGAKDAWGTTPLGQSPETIQHMRDLGIYNDFEKGQNSIVRRFNEGLMRGGALLGDLATRSVYAASRGFANLPLELGGPLTLLGGAASAVQEGALMELPSLHNPPSHEIPINQAIDLHLFDKPTAQQEAVARQAPPRRNAIVFPEHEATIPADAAPAVSADQAAPQIHQIVRENEPALFERWDAVNEQRQALQKWIVDLAAQPDTYNLDGRAVPADTPIHLGAAAVDTEGVPRPRANEALAKGLRADLEKLDDEAQELSKKVTKAYQDAREQAGAETAHVSPEGLAEPAAPAPAEPPVPKGMVRMYHGGTISQEEGPGARWVSPDKAYARDYRGDNSRLFYVDLPEDSPYLTKSFDDTGGNVKAPFTNVELPADVAKNMQEIDRNEIAAPRQVRNLSQRTVSIAVSVARDLQEAGRSATEARAAGAIVQAHYEARAARFGGALGDAQTLYDADAPSVRNEVRGKPGPRGRLNLKNNIITLFENANASTFMHESAHAWLEEFLQDAKHPAAPADLLADHGELKTWLKMEGEVPTREQHEQFARGFERYLMEGLAPSSRLARVFEQFRNWLTRIYRSVTRLDSNITPAIRGLYDRLLADPKSEVVIAPEREVRTDFADVHEADARTATPENAEARADNIRAERDGAASFITRAEINDARRRARAAYNTARTEAEGDRSGTGVPEGGAAGTGTEPGGKVTAPEPGEISPSGARATEDSAVTGSRFVDKAGNIRLDLISAPEEIDEIIRDTAKANDNFNDQRRGVLTDGQVFDLASDMGIDPAFLDRKAIGDAYSAEEITAVRMLLRQSAARVKAAMIAVKNGGADALELAANLAKAIAQNEMIQGKASAATAEWGRAGHALRNLDKLGGSIDLDALNTFLKENTGRSYSQLLQMARLGEYLQLPSKYNKIVRDTMGGKAKQAIIYYYVNSLISGPLTHSVYAVGNAIRAVSEPLLEIPVASAIRRVQGGEGVQLGEAHASLYGILKGSRDAWTPAYNAWKTGEQYVLPGQPGFGDPLGMYSLANAGPASRFFGIPGRSVAAIHSFFEVVRYEQGIQRLAFRQAVEEGLKGTPEFAIRIAKLTETPTEEMIANAGNRALTDLYMRPTAYDAATRKMADLVHSSTAGQILFPFVKIGLEIQRETFLKHTPLGVFDTEVRGDLAGKRGAAYQQEAIARQVIGMAALGTGLGLAMEGITTGYGPTDPKQRAEWLLSNQPYSIKLGSLNVPMAGLGPIGKLMQFGADLYEVHHFWNGEEKSKIALDYAKMFSRAVLDESFFRDMSELNDAINEPERHLGHYLYNWLPGWLPFSAAAGQVNRQLIDPYSKDVRDAFDAIRARTPGASFAVENRVDMFGNPVKSRGMNFDRYANDPVAQKLHTIGVGPGRLDREIQGVKLTEEQYVAYATMAGRLTHQYLEAGFATPGWDKMTKGAQILSVNSMIAKARAQAEAAVVVHSMGTDNDIVVKAREHKIKQLQ